MQGFLKRVRKFTRNQKGFTLVELLVVVAIIAILSAVLLPRLLGYTNQARVSRAMSDLATMKTIIETYAAGEGAGFYPNGGQDNPDGIRMVLGAKGIIWGDHDPNGIRDPWGTYYLYGTARDENGVSFRRYLILSAGPDRRFGTSDDIWVSDTASPTQGGTPDPNLNLNEMNNSALPQ